MNLTQHQHLEKIIKDYTESYKKIYIAGAIEHGGLMTDLPVKKLAEEALNEAQDSYAYNHTLLTNLDRVRTRLQQLKNTLSLEKYEWFDADARIKKGPRPEGWITTVGDIDDYYDPIRRIEAIERILF